MGSMTLKGLYLKDYPWREVIGTWTGFVDVCGDQRLVVALEIERTDNGNIWQPSNIWADDGENSWLWKQMLDLHGYDARQMEPIEHEDGSLFLVFMPP